MTSHLGQTPAAPSQRPDADSAYREYMKRTAQRMLAAGVSEAEVRRTLLELENMQEPAPTKGAAATPLVPLGPIRAPLGAALSAVQGLTFGVGDEAIGSLIGLLAGEDAASGRENYRKELAAYREAQPKAALLTELVGAAALPTGALGLGARAGALGARAIPALARLRSGAKIGAAFGAASGAASDIEEAPLSQRARNALVGTLVGGGFGGAFGVVAQPIARGVSAVGRGAARLGARAGIPWAQRLATRLATTPQEEARLIASEALAANGIRTANDLQAAIAQARSASPEAAVTLVDVMGGQGEQLAAAAALSRSPNKHMLIEGFAMREREAGPRIMRAMVRNLFAGDRPGLRNAYDVEIALRRRAENRAKQLVTQQLGEQLPDTPVLRNRIASVRALTNEGLDELLAGVPEFVAHREWPGSARLQAALDLGKNGFLKKAPETVARELSEMKTPIEKQMYRVGAAQAYHDVIYGTRRIGEAAQTVGGRVYGRGAEPIAARRIRALFADETAAQRFADLVHIEAQSARAAEATARPERIIGRGPPGVSISVPVVGRVRLGTRVEDERWSQELSDEVTNLLMKGMAGEDELEHAAQAVLAAQRSTRTRAQRRFVGAAISGGVGGGLGGGVQGRF